MALTIEMHSVEQRIYDAHGIGARTRTSDAASRQRLSLQESRHSHVDILEGFAGIANISQFS